MLRGCHTIPPDWNDKTPTEFVRAQMGLRTISPRGGVTLDIGVEATNPEIGIQNPAIIDPTVMQTNLGQIAPVAVGQVRALRKVGRGGQEAGFEAANRSSGNRGVRFDGHHDVATPDAGVGTFRKRGRRRR